MLCRCDCGSIIVTHLACLRRKNFTKSCGCLSVEKLIKRKKTHGLSKHPTYLLWESIKRRCYNKNAPSYSDYGRRGVIMCDEWKNDPKAFIEWALENGWKKELTIDRILGTLGYSPNNCRFITSKENGRNRYNVKLSMKKANKIRDKYYSGKYSLNQLAVEYNVHKSTIYDIIKNRIWT